MEIRDYLETLISGYGFRISDTRFGEKLRGVDPDDPITNSAVHEKRRGLAGAANYWRILGRY